MNWVLPAAHVAAVMGGIVIVYVDGWQAWLTYASGIIVGMCLMGIRFLLGTKGGATS